MGPESAKTVKGAQIVPPSADDDRRVRVPVEVDYGRRGKGYIFGAFRPHDGAAFTEAYGRRTIVNWVDFLGKVEDWIAPEVERVIGIVDNLNVHRATDVLLFCLAHPRWEFLFQPTYAPYLNLIEPWWKILRSLALKGRRFASWDEIVTAVREATSYWNAHRHPFEWGKRKRKRAARRAGLALVPMAA
jgi:transposase